MFKTYAVSFALVALVLVGCSTAAPGAATPSAASATAGASTVPSVAASAPPSIAASAAASATSAPTGSIDIGTVLPKTAGGLPLETKVFATADLDRASHGALTVIASIMGAELASMKLAIGFGGQSQGEEIVTVIQVPGASPEVMAKGFRSGIDPITITMGATGKSETISGKSVLRFEGKPPLYLYLVGDTAFAIRSDTATAEEILAVLP